MRARRIRNKRAKRESERGSEVRLEDEEEQSE
jgi:hypothetical protein